MNSLTDFIQNNLYPALFDRVDLAFPAYGFRRNRQGWETHLKLDLSTPKERRQDKCIIARNQPNRILEQGGESKDLLTLWMEQGSYNSTFEAVEALCNQIGITPPERQSSEEWEKFQKETEERERLLSMMRRAMRDNEEAGKEIVRYLHSGRGYSIGYIDKLRQWGIGVLTPEIAIELGDSLPRSLELDKHKLAIPYRSNGRILGFIFRDISGTLGGGDKYRYTSGKGWKKLHLFGLTGLKLSGDREKDRTLYIVEGQMDALHAQLEGMENIVATGGVALSPEALEEAKKKGVERVVIILDSEGNKEKDSQRDRDRYKALQLIHSIGLLGFSVTLPTREGEKTDVDSYLNSHNIEELETYIEGHTESAPLFFFKLLQEKYRDRFANQKQSEVWNELDIADFRRDLLNLLKDPIITPIDRDLLIQNAYDFAGISKEALKEEADALRAIEEEKHHKEESKKVLDQATQLLNAGKAEESMEYLSKELPRLSQMRRESEFQDLLTTPTAEDFKREMREKKEGLKTRYTLKKDGTTEPFTLPSGAVSLICAPTSHGKSTMLQNLLLQIAQDGEEGAVLYFTFEEEESSIKLQLLNKFLNLEITRGGNNLRTLQDYYTTGGFTQYFRSDARASFQEREPVFFHLLTTGKIRIFRKDWDAVKLRDFILFLSKRIKVRAVFIDYIQLLRISGYRGERRVELADISSLFNNLAIDTSLPIVMGAQLNRDSASPLEMHAQNLAESADIERYANTILALWNTSFKPTTKSKAKDSKEMKDFEERLGISLGTGGSIYALLVKNRSGVVGADGVIEYNGNTGVMSQNEKGDNIMDNTSSKSIF